MQGEIARLNQTLEQAQRQHSAVERQSEADLDEYKQVRERETQRC